MDNNNFYSEFIQLYNKLGEDQFIKNLINDHQKFNDFVYVQHGFAIKELEIRLKQKNIINKTNEFLRGNIPKPMKKAKVVLGRHVATPNYEILRFLQIASESGLEPLFFEHHHDKFVTNNESKYHLANLLFFVDKTKRGNDRREYLKVVDFDRFNGKKIIEVETLFGNKLIDFHHDLLKKINPAVSDDSFFNASEWLYEMGGKTAHDYYKCMLMLFVHHGILFENYLINKKEQSFTQKIFLPAFISIIKELHLRPLIVALEPTNIEDDKFWLSYPLVIKKYI